MKVCVFLLALLCLLAPVISKTVTKDWYLLQSDRDVTCAPGDTVVWTNKEVGSIEHTVTSDETGVGAFDSDIMEPDQTFSVTFLIAGDFDYHCDLHDDMKGTVHVTNAATATGPVSAALVAAVGFVVAQIARN